MVTILIARISVPRAPHADILDPFELLAQAPSELGVLRFGSQAGCGEGSVMLMAPVLPLRGSTLKGSVLALRNQEDAEDVAIAT